MIQHFLKSRRLVALLLVVLLVLIQANVAFAECFMTDTGAATSMSAMEDCTGCGSITNGVDRYETLSNICGNHYSRSYVPPAQEPEILAIATISPLNTETTALPRVSLHIHAAHSEKSRLIYRLQRLLI